MPYQSHKVRGKSCYRVYNKNNKRVFAKCTSRKNAIKQMRLLRAIEYNKKFTPYSGSRTNRLTRKNK